MFNTKWFFLICCVLSVLSVSYRVIAKSEVYFACERGFQFETKSKAARCIRQERQIFRSTEPCNKGKSKQENYRLKIDNRGNRDLCVIMSVEHKNNRGAHKINQTIVRAKAGIIHQGFPPSCRVGYQLQVRRGKDSCGKGKPEVIKPPVNKVKR